MACKILKPPESKYAIPGYFGCVMDLYNGSQIYVPALAIAGKQFPNIDWIEPAKMDWDNTTWLNEWSKIIPDLKLITILPRPDKTIGKGCYKEIIDSRFIGLPVYIFDHGEQIFSPFKKVIKLPFIKRTFPHFARVYSHSLALEESSA